MGAGDILSFDPGGMSGAVVLKGTRVAVAGLFEYLGNCDTLHGFLLDFRRWNAAKRSMPSA